MKVYVASSLHNTNVVKNVQNLLRSFGVTITYDWTTHGQFTNEDDLIMAGEAEEQGVRDCDVFFMIHPARHGTHVELGIARALNKHIVIWEAVEPSEKKPFYYRPKDHPSPIHRFTDVAGAIAHTLVLLGIKQKDAQ